jgi:carbonic anhydrase/acetyltransferase-like protein (isoleucine patch superfamily)
VILTLGRDTPKIHPSAFIHPSAEISGKVKIGARASVWGGCVLRGDVDWIIIGDDCNIQDGSVFHASPGLRVRLGKGVTVGHRAVVHGATVGDYSLIGMSATLLDRSVVNDHCLVAAGAVVLEGGIIPAGRLAVGLPARVARPLTPAERKMIVDRAGVYVGLAARYRKALNQNR